MKNVESLGPCVQAKITAKKKGYNLKCDVLAKCFGLLKLIESNESYLALVSFAG